MQESRLLARKDGRIIIHFDYDCFYAAVVEQEQPALKHCALAIQQKQIIVTCNYEARRQGLHKLQLVTEAKKLCPDVVIVLGEDLTRFRNASKELYQYLKAFSWNGKAERLGFDEVWMDVTDIVDYNLDIMNRNALQSSFFQLIKDDPTQGFEFDATGYAGYCFPETPSLVEADDTVDDVLALRLRLGSHLAMHMRHKLEEDKGYTSTVGISVSKLLSKLVGNLHKPKGQTTIIPPYTSPSPHQQSNVTLFLDPYEIGKIPNIGFKTAQKLREAILHRDPLFDAGLVYGGTKETVTVRDVRLHPDINPEKLEKLLGGPGSPHGIGVRVWQLLHGVDDTQVSFARPVPTQISIEDSYIRLDTMSEVLRELHTLSLSLLNRMRIDLLGSDDDDDDNDGDIPHDGEFGDAAAETKTSTTTPTRQKWLAHPRTIRLSTRPRPPLNPDGTRPRTFKRISHSAPLPLFVFNTAIPLETLVTKLVQEVLVPMFRRLHGEKTSNWNLSLVNVAVTNMVVAAGESREADGRDIGGMFRRQEGVLREFRVVEGGDEGRTDDVSLDAVRDMSLEADSQAECEDVVMEDYGNVQDERWDEDDDFEENMGPRCELCGASVPVFARAAHIRFHEIED